MIKPISLSDAKKLFLSLFPKKGIKVDKVTLNGGHTNISYCIICGKTKYQMKIARPSAKKNIKAKLIFNKLMNFDDYIYKNLNNGITIRKWIEGKVLDNWGPKNTKELYLMFDHLKKVHALPKKYFSNFGSLRMLRSRVFLSTLPIEFKNKYLFLVKKYSTEPQVISKIDCAFNNVVVDTNGKAHVIDNEWVQLAPEYWDYAESLRWTDFNLNKINLKKYIKNFNLDKLKDFMFMSNIYNYLWTFRMDPDPTLDYYRRYLYKKIKKTYKSLEK